MRELLHRQQIWPGDSVDFAVSRLEIFRCYRPKQCCCPRGRFSPVVPSTTRSVGTKRSRTSMSRALALGSSAYVSIVWTLSNALRLTPTFAPTSRHVVGNAVDMERSTVRHAARRIRHISISRSIRDVDMWTNLSHPDHRQYHPRNSSTDTFANWPRYRPSGEVVFARFRSSVRCRRGAGHGQAATTTAVAEAGPGSRPPILNALVPNNIPSVVLKPPPRSPTEQPSSPHAA